MACLNRHPEVGRGLVRPPGITAVAVLFSAELLELSDANLTTCNLKLAEYFIRFTFDNILLHVTQAKKTNREVRHLALPVLFSQLELIYT